MSLRSQLLSISDNIFDEFLEDVIDVVETSKQKHNQQVSTTIRTVRPDLATPVNSIYQTGIHPNQDQEFKRIMGINPHSRSFDSPLPGIDKVTYEKLDRIAKTAISTEQKTKKDSIMSLLGNIPGLGANAFGKVTGNKIALGFDGQIVFRRPDGSYVKLVTDEEGNKTQVQVLDLKLDVDFYRVPTQQLAVGDLIELDNQLLYVEENSKGGLKFVNPLTGAKSSKLQQSNILGIHFYSKIVSFFDLAGTQGGVGLNGINPMMLMALQGKSGAGGDISELLILSSLMGAQGQGGQPAINPMMLMMLGDKAEGDTFKQFMMLQMLAGQGGANPFAAFTPNVAPATVVAKASTRRTAAPKRASVKAAPKKAAVKSAAKKSTSKRSRATQVKA